MFVLSNTITDWLSSLADYPVLIYVALFVVLVVTGAGAPITEEIITVFAGVLVHRQVLDPVIAWIVVYVGVLVADSVAVYIGWHFGKAVLYRRWLKRLLHPRRVLWARHQVQEHGAWMIVASRFIPATRYPTLVISGMMHLPRWKFLTADGLGALVTVTLHMFLGWWFARVATSFDEVMEYEGPIALALAAVGVAIIAIYFLIRRARHRRKV